MLQNRKVGELSAVGRMSLGGVYLAATLWGAFHADVSYALVIKQYNYKFESVDIGPADLKATLLANPSGAARQSSVRPYDFLASMHFFLDQPLASSCKILIKNVSLTGAGDGLEVLLAKDALVNLDFRDSKRNRYSYVANISAALGPSKTQLNLAYQDYNMAISTSHSGNCGNSISDAKSSIVIKRKYSERNVSILGYIFGF